MRSNDTLLKLRRFEVNEKQQKVNEIEDMIADFQRSADDLKRQIDIEEETARIHDVNHYAYPPFAKAARQRRDNLMSSIADLERLKPHEADGIVGVISGRAIYDGRLDLAAALAYLQG